MEWLTGRHLYRAVVTDGVLKARESVWIATANLKDLYVPGIGRRYRPILTELSRLARDGVQLRVIHAELPSRSFRETFDQLPALVDGGLELQICPRSHWKMVIVDGELGYAGSANFTGAGLGAKAEGNRNLELGAVGRDREVHKFTITNAAKDLRYAAGMAMLGGMANPMGAAMRSMFAEAEAAGHGASFVPELADLFAAANGLDLAEAVAKGAKG